MKSLLREEFFKNGRFDNLPVYDLHGHMGSLCAIHFPAPDADSMVKSMEKSDIRMLVFCHHAALLSPDIGNRANIEAVKKHPGRLRAYCAINPNYPDIIKKDLQSFDKYYGNTYVGFKFLASYHNVSITDPRYEPALKMADERKLMVLMHTWGSSGLCGPPQIRTVAGRYPGVRFLIGHSCHNAWDEAVKLARDFPNVYLELCAVLNDRGALEKLSGEADTGRIVFGTDLPWFSYNYYIGAVLGADITDETRIKILSSNAEKLLSEHIPLKRCL